LRKSIFLYSDSLIENNNSDKTPIKISYFREEEILKMLPIKKQFDFDDKLDLSVIEKEIIGILDEDPDNEDFIISKLGNLSDQNQEKEIYTELFRVLASIEMSSEESAKECWNKIIEHRNSCSRLLGTQFSFRAAMLNYFISENKKLANPKIIEIKIYENTLKSALLDVLTGVFNRRYYEEIIQNEINRARRRKGVISLCVLDIDNFKHFNDAYGHLEGDTVLKTVASIIKKTLRREDIVCRYGGEEFVIIMPDSTAENSFIVMHRIQEELKKERFHDECISFSCGISCYPKDTENKDELFIKADKAMYMSKANGKDQICIYGNDRRNKIRIEVNWNISYSIAGSAQENKSGGEFHLCQTFDVSLDGLCFVTSEHHTVDEVLNIVFHDQNSLNFQNKMAKVVWVKPTDEGKNKIGLKFI